ncbi:MAG: hypothetical protein KGQ41_04960 [Alphaproteobacteria bacterium]|nr:hypothetical protein [Alphaproteobacteria bacterium]
MGDTSSARSKFSQNAGYTTVGIAGVVALNFLIGGWQNIGPGQNAIHVRFSQIVEQNVKPGFKFKWPWIDRYYVYNAPDNVARTDISIGFTTTSGENRTTLCAVRNTADQNSLCSVLRLHYVVDLAKGNAAMWYDKLGSENAKAAIQDFALQSHNAVAAQINLRTSGVPEPKTFMDAFLLDLDARLAKNAVPVRIDGVELTHVSATMSVPTQYRARWDEPKPKS